MAITSCDHETSEIHVLDCSDMTGAPQLAHPRTTYALPLQSNHLPPLRPPLSLLAASGVLCSIDHSGSNFYIHTNANGAVNFQIFRSSLSDLPSPTLWHVVVPHNPNIFIEEMRVTAACVNPFTCCFCVTTTADTCCSLKKSTR